MQHGHGSITRHACHCGKEFIRKEHLRRHQATHSERAHICLVCQRSFTRGDLLRRHLKRHEIAETQASRRVRACDACHANKTRCSGGPQCSLCAKRGVSCTYKNDKNGTNDSSSSAAAAAAAAMSATNNVEVHPSNEDSIPTSAPSANSLPLLHPESDTSFSKPPPVLPPESFNFLLGLTIQPSRSNEEPRNAATQNSLPACCPRVGMETIHQALLSRSESALDPAHGASGRLRSWVEACSKIYFQKVHPHWPILHSPTFSGFELPPFNIQATAIILGIWVEIHDSASEDVSDIVLACHRLMVTRLFQELSEPELADNGRAWPMDFYQSVLLNIIFAIYTNRPTEMAQASLLLALLVTQLRRAGVFSSKAAEYQNKFHREKFLPLVINRKEARKRLLISVFKADAYLALISGQPPTIHNEELEITLPQTHGVWNAYDLGVFYKRYLREPMGRDEAKVPMLTAHNVATLTASMRSDFLAEDIELAILRIVQCTWRYGHLRLATGADPAPESIVLDDLEAWKVQLTKLSDLLRAQSLDISADRRYPLDAYRDDDDEMPAREWMQMALKRAMTIIQDATLLYHVLYLNLLLDPRLPYLKPLPSSYSTGISQYPSSAGHLDIQPLFEWLMSNNGRKATSHALAIVGMTSAMVENPPEEEEDAEKSLRPMQRIAVALARHVHRLDSVINPDAAVLLRNARLGNFI